MRSLVISVVALLLVIIPWAIFMNTAAVELQDMIDTVKTRGMAGADLEDWGEAEEALDLVFEKWYRGRTGFSVFLNAAAIDDIECSLARAEAYVRAKEKSSALGEMAYLHHQLLFLLENEMTTLENVL